MKRTIALVITSLCMVFAIVGALAGPTAAQGRQASSDGCFPGSGNDYPPTTANGTQGAGALSIVSGTFPPGGTGTLVLTGAVPGATYCGQVLSEVVILDSAVADANGTITFHFTVPAGFALSAFHHIDIYSQGAQVEAFNICVDQFANAADASACTTSGTQATLVPTADPGSGGTGAATTGTGTGGPLARTGAGHIGLMVEIAAMAILIGALLVYLRRRAIEQQAR